MNVKNNCLIYILFFVYFLFSQVHPFTHFHTYQAENKSKLNFCFHPIGEECPIEHERCEHHHEQNACHGHCISDMNHILRTDNRVVLRFSQVFFIPCERPILKPFNFSITITDPPLPLRPKEVVSLYPCRSPPFFT